jgi:hypothetical protein
MDNAEEFAGEVDASHWTEFEAWLQYIERQYAAFKARSEIPDRVSRPIFRGQSNKLWKLETSLERYFRQPIKLAAYARLIGVIKSSVETLTGRRWSIPEFPELIKDQEIYTPTFMPLFKGEAYEFLIYLRHHGFPSPLLDWSASPYVAAFFAYSEAQEDVDTRVAVYAFVYDAVQPRSGSATKAGIHALGPYVRSHPRHFLQQSRYTVCIKDAERSFASHEEAVSWGQGAQDLLWKINLPSCNKRLALRYLDRHNINAYSLYASDEGLMRTLAFREIENYIERGLLPTPKTTQS